MTTEYPKGIKDEIERVSRLANVKVDDIKTNIDAQVKNGVPLELALAKYKDVVSNRMGGEIVENVLARVIGSEPARNFEGNKGAYISSTIHAFIQTGEGQYTMRSIRMYGERAPLVDNYPIGSVIKSSFKLKDDNKTASVLIEPTVVQAKFPTIQELIEALPSTHPNALVDLKNVKDVITTGPPSNHFFRGLCSSMIMAREDTTKIAGFNMSTIDSNPVVVWINDGTPIKEGNVTVYGYPSVNKRGGIQISARGVFQ